MADSESAVAVAEELFRASIVLSNLHLHYAAKWATEALNGLAKSVVDAVDFAKLSSMPSSYEPQGSEMPSYMLAKSYFSCKEFDRAAVTLAGLSSPCCVFLRVYSQMLSLDKRATEEGDGSMTLAVPEEDEDDPSSDSSPSQLAKILEQIDAHPQDPFLLYLYGAIFLKKKKYTIARGALYQSVSLFPYNWSAWAELANTFTGFDEATTFLQKLKQGPLAGHVMAQVFECVLLQQFFQSSPPLLESLASLVAKFPRFQFIKVQQFLVAYNATDYVKAEQIYDEVLLADPLRLDEIDTYSNMLFVMENRSKLSYLAQYVSQIDKFRPETCCVVANYHSMKGEHEKAIMYFQRALALNKNCISAWTLMGHEFVEVKNSHAAIESYRRAVDTNPRDYRAWYGLGQAYEVLDMNLYALYYYQRATNLQPLDRRMWIALGNCFEKSDKLPDAIKAFEKVIAIDLYKHRATEGDPEGVGATPAMLEPSLLFRLAQLSDRLGDAKNTHRYMKLCFEQEYWSEGDEPTRARIWLARHALTNRRFDEAYELAKDIARGSAHEIEEARVIARDARSRMK
ncbi:anaphase-promoting complex subunit Cdc23p [Diutina catenulata]